MSGSASATGWSSLNAAWHVATSRSGTSLSATRTRLTSCAVGRAKSARAPSARARRMQALTTV
eukprot:13248448-Alexandrium_andersonii.AAC.1